MTSNMTTEFADMQSTLEVDSLLAQQLQDPYTTFSYSKYSCVAWFYWIHVVLNYCIAVAGAACLVTRVVPRSQVAHAWFGRMYVACMLWSTATSLLIHNTGLPEAVLWSFLWVLGGLTLGWLVILIHRERLHARALAGVADTIKLEGLQGDLQAAVAAEKARIAARKTFLQRLLSLKALHGMLMFTSWINIVGRVFATRPASGYQCHTYPVNKALEGGALSFVPVNDPDYDSLPWAGMGEVAWAVVLSVGPMAGAALVGAVYSFFAARRARAAGDAARGPARGPLTNVSVEAR